MVERNSKPKVKTNWLKYGVVSLTTLVFLTVVITIVLNSQNGPVDLNSIRTNDAVVLKDNHHKFPYLIVKITKIDDAKVTFDTAKYSYSRDYKAEGAIHKNLNEILTGNLYEMPLEDFKKLDIVSIKHTN